MFVIRDLSQPHIICKIVKLIISGPEAFIAACVINASDTASGVTFMWAIPEDKIRSSTRFAGGFGKADLCTNASFAFIEIAVCLLVFFSTNVILNCKSLVYLNAV